MDGATIANAFCKMASRLRETHTFKKLRSPTSVSSTRNTHFQNQVSSRLREALLFLKKMLSRLRETPTLGGKLLRHWTPNRADWGRAQPSRAGPIPI